MLVIDQNSALNSLNEALVPNPCLIDGRTEQDWLYFLTEFSKLINFYNDTNTIEGNWNPFLLKDPVFLMAAISRTNYKGLHSTYKNSCTEIQTLLSTNSQGFLNSKALNQLFDHISAIYKIMERWTHYMQSSNETYDLKNYILHEVQNKLSIDFWAVQSFRQYLYTAPSKGTYIAAAPYPDFVSFDVPLWTINKDKRPFWEIFGYDTEQTILKALDNVTSFCLTILTKIGDRLFNFLETIIHHSANEFKKLSLQKSKFPDTTLLRSFVNVLQIQQEQLNGISQKHLDFYYKTILKQKELPALADSAFLCAALAKNNSVLELPAGTLFNGGVDAEKNPVVFASLKDVTLNPAVIKSVQTLSYQAAPNTLSYNLQSVAKPSAVQQDETGKTISWSTFGATTPPTAPLYTGMAFASPMLLLREGQRNITVTLELDSEINLTEFQGASYFLSTANSWLEVPLAPSAFVPTAKSLAIEINLDPAEPAIEPFVVHPDGLQTTWPMLKIIFKTISKPAAPPKILAITIALDITGVKTFQLYNDFGELNTKNPFPPFGPIPLFHSNFIIGNNEIFSKPLDSFVINIDWDKIPSDFRTYYAAYNNYIADPDAAGPVVKSRVSLARLLNRTTDPLPPPVPGPFNNPSFIADFNILQEKTWNGLIMTKTSKPVVPPVTPETAPVFVPVQEIITPLYLFDPTAGDPDVPFNSTCSSYYKYNNHEIADTTPAKTPQPDPYIQVQPFKFTDTSSSGFIRMVLSGNEYGFGSEIYPNVVANIALQNGNLFNKAKGDPISKFIVPANLPFAPKIKTFSADYKASVTYKLDVSAGDYPLQYFVYTPFKNYQLFDSTDTASTLLNTSIVGVPQTGLTSGFPVYPSFSYSGALFLELEQLICNSTLSFYFELARNATTITPGDSVSYFYLNNSGWKEIKALSDQTSQFKSSGIIELPIPEDCNNNGAFMPGTNNWLSIVVSGKGNTYSNTTFLQTNGFRVQRTGTTFLTDTQTPQISSNTITKPQTVIPQIATLVQPFASFGGKAAETNTHKNQRVSHSIKTKNRAVSPADYYTLIAERFDTVYFSKVVHKKSDNSTTVYVVRKITDESDTGAYLPLVTNDVESAIQKFIKDSTSPFATVNISNFNPEYVCITAQIGLKSGYQETLIHNTVNLALKNYLSPWITAYDPQIAIDQPLIDAKVHTFLLNMEGVATVDAVSFSSYRLDPVTGIKTTLKSAKTRLQSYGPTTLLVSADQHNITF
ncbi:hypothetical protein D0809_08545 [Flavobacterium circumlabens]|uniref:Baseplate protein J-like domain-containing protein n=1 Tax=Flavobacterium circumlabens TaxID=2133765 RepID=A0A4Y7UFL4_9FLAO|nr:hypothetical protein [Flavobacterium circumlabens]TCN59963.1 hypothetical protein EV142_102583 [Flavobacterium circumlabens]TEB45207.1 hypothetical protein D0809_08545 [Flavobacterium circumlabens]